MQGGGEEGGGGREEGGAWVARPPEEVRAKFGVAPAKMVDLLALVGNKSEGVKGVILDPQPWSRV